MKQEIRKAAKDKKKRRKNINKNYEQKNLKIPVIKYSINFFIIKIYNFIVFHKRNIIVIICCIYDIHSSIIKKYKKK